MSGVFLNPEKKNICKIINVSITMYYPTSIHFEGRDESVGNNFLAGLGRQARQGAIKTIAIRVFGIITERGTAVKQNKNITWWCSI